MGGGGGRLELRTTAVEQWWVKQNHKTNTIFIKTPQVNACCQQSKK